MITEILEKTGNRLLELDPETAARLAKLEGRVFRLELSVVNQTLYLIPTATGFEIKREWAVAADVTLRGSPLAFAEFGLRQRGVDSQVFAEKRVTIEGDVELAQDLQTVIRQMDLDLEELLSHYIGDVAARQFGRGARALRLWTLDAARSLRLDMQEYMVEESRLLAPGWRVDGFIQQVAELRANAERLEQRVERLRARAGSRPVPGRGPERGQPPV